MPYEVNNFNKMKLNKYILLVIPLIYTIVGIYFQQMTGIYSLRNVDPEYIYFISGLSVANGHLELGHVDNPGTPLQYFLAITFRIIYFFRSHEISFIEDALANSDLYLITSNLILITLIGFFLYAAGSRIVKSTENLSFGLLIQSTPFYTTIIYGNIGRVTPENLLPIPIILLSIVLIKIAKEKIRSDSWQSIIALSAIVAFGLSIKLTFIPILIIPLIVISGWGKKLAYLVTTPAFFLLFALPATLRLKTFWNWAKALFLHSGQYGQGDKTIINIDSLWPNIQKLWYENELFFLVLFFFIGVVIIVNIKGKIKLDHQKIAIAVVLAVVVQLLLVAKHFEQRYFVPALFLLPVMFVLIFILTEKWQVKIRGINTSFIITVIFIFAYSKSQALPIKQLSTHLTNEVTRQMPAYHYLRSIAPNAYRIIVPGYYGCPSPEYALRFSYGWAGKQKEIYKPYLAKLFSKSIIVYPWDGSFNFWGEQPDIENTNMPIYVYIVHTNHLAFFKEELAKHVSWDFDLEQTFLNEKSKEAIYLLKKK